MLLLIGVSSNLKGGYVGPFHFKNLNPSAVGSAG